MEESQTMIHVRFSPDGAVIEIGERPAALSNQAWFKQLSDKAGMSYQPLSGGRGVFRIDPSELQALQSAAVH